MPAKGLVVPHDIANRIAVSYARHGAQLEALTLLGAPASYDCRSLGYVTPVKDQGNCGSCWDFSGTGIAEMSSVVAGKAKASETNWSEQSVLDCGNNGGCNGDWPESALEQAKNSGLANTKDYPYKASRGSCRNVPHPNTIQDYGYVGKTDGVPGVDAIKAAMLAHGPISVAVAADDAFANYSGGVFKDSGSRSIDHAVILVGWQDDASIPAGGYWILRNSWGTGWGEQGYMRIAYGANLVGYGAMWASSGSPAPVPPVPPVPPIPPGPLPPILHGSGKTQPYTFKVPNGFWGSTTVTIPGQNFVVDVPTSANAGGIDWKAVLADALALFTDFKAGNWLAVIADVQKLLKDFGVLSQALGIGPVVPWGQIIADGLALLTAVLAKNIPGVIAAALKLLADFGIVLGDAPPITAAPCAGCQ